MVIIVSILNGHLFIYFIFLMYKFSYSLATPEFGHAGEDTLRFDIFL